ncbi:hypothetical protein DRO97_01795 [Archaeoglobales archaeon]|nr:MAG: hypothetical protein DRO97_01795 [Archaeoglobales archaeon]
MEQKLVVEFGVDKEIEKDYGYVEKYLTYRNNTIPYKAITRKGQFLAIVSRKYHLIENERVIDICKEIAEKNNYNINIVEYFTRVHVFLESGDVGFVVHNSVDGSYALRIDVFVRLSKDVKTIFKLKGLEQVYRKHFGSAKIVVEDLDEIIKELEDKVDDYWYFINKMDTINAKDRYEELKVLEEILPKRYVVDALHAIHNGITLKRVYEKVASSIWTADIDMKTKVQYFDTLNQLMFAVVGWE